MNWANVCTKCSCFANRYLKNSIIAHAIASKIMSVWQKSFNKANDPITQLLLYVHVDDLYVKTWFLEKFFWPLMLFSTYKLFFLTSFWHFQSIWNQRNFHWTRYFWMWGKTLKKVLKRTITIFAVIFFSQSITGSFINYLSIF